MIEDIISENYLRTYLHNARVLLIGGSELPDGYAQDLSQSKDFDVIVRVNNHYQEQGGRVDILYTSGTQELDSDLRGITVVECKPEDMKTKTREFCETNFIHYIGLDTNQYQENNKVSLGSEWLNQFRKDLGTLPFTGVIAIKHLLMMPIQFLALEGFGFYSISGIVPHRRDAHDVRPQLEWLADLAVQESRLQISEELANLLAKAHNARAARIFKMAKAG